MVGIEEYCTIWFEFVTLLVGYLWVHCWTDGPEMTS